MPAAGFIIGDDFFQAYFLPKLVQRIPADNAGSYFRKKAFLLVRVFLEQVIGNNGAQNGIPQVFKTLVGFLDSSDILLRYGTMPRRQAIQVDI